MWKWALGAVVLIVGLVWAWGAMTEGLLEEAYEKEYGDTWSTE